MENREIKILIFSINNQYYATDIMEVERILGYEIPTNLPDSPEFVEGVINYQGDILPIISIAKKFNINDIKDKKDSKIIVIKEEENKMGIIVDVVSEVSDVNLKNIEEPPEIVSGISKRYIKGLIKLEKKIIIFLNLTKILTDKEKEEILG
ncbi:purine-binding chemotaxis protein CheW [Clostridium botulinum C]|uniref:Purine-binding chemotaxis protein CheW n=2 Tax=Clostridium botulinum TaxID=1491 RepID=A0A9Q4XU32_CLOBO|nr:MULTISPECIES: chemotaxis protein CheW [Clostridium]KEI10699.1 chemotaxis protein CheW [Clostridium sp. K25]MCD3194058.1 purine-binding chemotaxis protein CheW [Clostridium botulinum C]MCD3199313.1 purine-binding chemotaxis protein CheW [Clostridium botulinum C]MCD3204788.1 purine-binding chemotaxis protein CheW [Clostridium botulinum C]MCD3207613.1 purine-binding chemotaxis protein CheW [Clostridium botulinum C]